MGNVAIVTGGSRGIGAATAAGLAADGWDVLVGYRSNHAAADLVVERCTSEGVRAAAVRADLAGQEGIDALFTAADDLGPVGALVNNAGIVDVKARVDEMSRERVEQMMAINAVSPILVAAEAVRRMSTAHGGAGGVIVNISSAAARVGSPGQYVDYAASKAAIDTFTLGLAKEVAAEGIRVVAIRPGLIYTDIHASGGQPDRVQRNEHQIPMGRGGQPGEVAAAVVWLCSDAASYVTGTILDVSGGR
jgi:NAD(P)-dependent dehydrogenase (short-subunit alcohol dehydrogenase family)